MSVVQFPGGKPPAAEEPMIFVCNCGCTSFELRSDGTTECCSCGVVSPTASEYASSGWIKTLPDLDHVVEKPADGTRKISRIGSAGAALQKVVGNASLEKSVAVVVLQADGVSHSWASEEWWSDPQPEWLEDRIKAIRDMLLPPDRRSDDEPELDLGDRA